MCEFYFTIPLVIVENCNLKLNTLEKVENNEFQNKDYSIKILLVEDNRVNQLVAIGILKKLGYVFDLANNGKEALIKLEKNKFDLILMDINMPEMDGLTAMKHIKQIFPEKNRPKVIAVTANTLSEEKEACFNAGMDDYITKPINKMILKSILAKYC